MLLETLNSLNQAGIEALKSACGLGVRDREVSLVREGNRSYPALISLKLKGCPLPLVHLGCDAQLAGRLAGMSPGPGGQWGLGILAESFLAHLLEQFDNRNPRGVVEDIQDAPVTLHTRGVRTFQFRLDTEDGQMYCLAEVPSRIEVALAKGSEFLASMESIYLPGDWHGSKGFSDAEAMDNFMTFLRKTEGDIYLEPPAGDGTATLNSGLLVEVVKSGDQTKLKLITDFSDPALGVPAPGEQVKASVGVEDRSLEFVLTYEEPATHELSTGASVPCALFSLPSEVTIGQRRRTFRVPVSDIVRVEIETAPGQEETSPWSADEVTHEGINGRLADLSFSGARIISDHSQLCSYFPKDVQVVCRMHFPEMKEPVQVMGVIRRSTASPADRNQWQDEIGLEFLISPGGDRAGLDFIRQFVLEVQRMNLSQRLQVSGT